MSAAGRAKVMQAIVISTKGIARTEKSQKYTMLRFLDCVHLRFTPLEMTEESFSYELPAAT